LPLHTLKPTSYGPAFKHDFKRTTNLSSNGIVAGTKVFTTLLNCKILQFHYTPIFYGVCSVTSGPRCSSPLACAGPPGYFHSECCIDSEPTTAPRVMNRFIVPTHRRRAPGWSGRG